MKTIRVRTWDGFVKQVEKIRADFSIHTHHLKGGEKHTYRPDILFRGQANSKWKLQTTLERKTDEQFNVLDYIRLATHRLDEIESFTGIDWRVPDLPALRADLADKQREMRVHLPIYDYLVYLRHHAFPSPLLDWTESPYIAAYFAFAEPVNENPAIYCYIERPAVVKVRSGGDPTIYLKGPFVKTHKRHFAQKAWYTIAAKWNYGTQNHDFCSHESVFDSNDKNQDLLFKIILPKSERIQALRKLNDYNINHFTLFQSEDSLIKAIELKAFDLS